MKKLKFHIVTIFPQAFSALEVGVIGRARQLKKLIDWKIWDLRDFTSDQRRTVDDRPYGGGAGMVLKPEPLFRAIARIKRGKKKTMKVIFFTPDGKLLNQPLVKKLAKAADTEYILICGRYEGIDQRVRDQLVDLEISIGEYVLAGGEIPAMAFIEAVSREVPGVLGNSESTKEESFSKELKGKKEYPCYTRPADYRGLKVPEILISGHHGKVGEWRKKKIK